VKKLNVNLAKKFEAHVVHSRSPSPCNPNLTVEQWQDHQMHEQKIKN